MPRVPPRCADVSFATWAPVPALMLGNDLLNRRIMRVSIVGEGSVHVVFRRRGEPRVWRLRKDPRWWRHSMCPKMTQICESLASDTLFEQCMGDVIVRRPFRRLSSFDCFALLPQEWLGVKFMPCAFVSVVPESMVQSFETVYQSHGASPPLLSPSIGLVIPDATQTWLPLGADEFVQGPCFAVEIKPKQGERTRSWLVEAKRASFKSQFSRICITRAAVETKPPPAPDENYQALFSGDMASMQHAIHASLNNQTGPVIAYFMKGTRIKAPTNALLVSKVVAAILAREPLLQRLRAAQQALDCLDIDGVASLLAAPGLVGLDVDGILSCRSNPARLSPEAEAVASICRCNPGHLAASRPQTRQTHRKTSIAALQKLSKTDSMDLVKNWLNALMLDDASIIVSASRLASAKRGAKPRLQTCDVTGVIQLSKNETYTYAVAILDTGPKPASKVKVKCKNEWGIIKRAELALRV